MSSTTARSSTTAMPRNSPPTKCACRRSLEPAPRNGHTRSNPPPPTEKGWRDPDRVASDSRSKLGLCLEKQQPGAGGNEPPELNVRVGGACHKYRSLARSAWLRESPLLRLDSAETCAISGAGVRPFGRACE